MTIERPRPPARGSAFAWLKARPIATALALALALPMAAGCGENEGPPPAARKKLALKDVPKPIDDAAKKALPGYDIEEAWENLDKDRKVQSYEIKGRNSSGKIREVRVDLAGKILEIE